MDEYLTQEIGGIKELVDVENTICFSKNFL